MKNNIKSLTIITMVLVFMFLAKVDIVNAADPYFVSHVVYDSNLKSYSVEESELKAVITDTESGAIYVFKSIQYGTTMYYDLNGKIEKVKLNGKVLKDFTKEVITTKAEEATKKEQETTAPKTQTWNLKAKKPKMKKVKKTYKGNTYVKGKGWKEKKVKYVYGYKLTWGKTKGAADYVVQRYAPAEKKYVTIKKSKEIPRRKEHIPLRIL